jgi:lipopolysaccharide export system protein LptA
MIARFSAIHALAALGLALGCALGAAAQPAGQPQSQSSMQGFSMNRDQPVRIESNSLEVRDKIRQATFIGDVKLTQGETTLKCKALVVFYEDTPPAAAKKGAPAAPQAQKGSQQIKRAEAKGDVFVTQKDQTATGENGVFDLKSNTVTMTGNVVVTQGTAVMRGERMVVDLTTGVTRVESTKGTPDKPGRVEFMTIPGAAKDAKAAPAAPAAPPAVPPPAAKAAPKGPIRIN